MKKQKPIPIIIFFFSLAFVQLYAQNGPVAAGGESSGAGGTVSYSIGQVDYIAPAGSNGNTNEGLQQPYEFFSMGVEEDPSIQLELSLYPNPTSSHVVLNISKPDLSGLYYQLYDMNGQLLVSKAISGPITEIILGNYASASYLLKVSDTKKELKTFKIIKK